MCVSDHAKTDTYVMRRVLEPLARMNNDTLA